MVPGYLPEYIPYKHALGGLRRSLYTLGVPRYLPEYYDQNNQDWYPGTYPSMTDTTNFGARVPTRVWHKQPGLVLGYTRVYTLERTSSINKYYCSWLIGSIKWLTVPVSSSLQLGFPRTFLKLRYPRPQENRTVVVRDTPKFGAAEADVILSSATSMRVRGTRHGRG